MRKSGHPAAAGSGNASAAATAPAKQRVQPAPSPEQDDSTVAPDVPAPLETPDAREARIAKLRRKHADGSYKVDARKVAAKIVDRHLEK